MFYIILWCLLVLELVIFNVSGQPDVNKTLEMPPLQQKIALRSIKRRRARVRPSIPTLTQTPSDTSEFVPGNSVQFTCTTYSFGSFSYKLLKDGQVFSTSGSNIFNIANLEVSNSGEYSCVVVNNGVDSFNSNSLTITVGGGSVEGYWTEWVPYLSCSAACGVGYQRHTRRCTHQWSYYSEPYCYGVDEKYESCQERPCRVNKIGENCVEDNQCGSYSGLECKQWICSCQSGKFYDETLQKCEQSKYSIIMIVVISIAGIAIINVIFAVIMFAVIKRKRNQFNRSGHRSDRFASLHDKDENSGHTKASKSDKTASLHDKDNNSGHTKASKSDKSSSLHDKDDKSGSTKASKCNGSSLSTKTELESVGMKYLEIEFQLGKGEKEEDKESSESYRFI